MNEPSMNSPYIKSIMNESGATGALSSKAQEYYPDPEITFNTPSKPQRSWAQVLLGSQRKSRRANRKNRKSRKANRKNRKSRRSNRR